MNQILSIPMANPTMPTERQTRAMLRLEAEQMLRDLAFVLKMTERVRNEIETGAEEETHELVTA